VSNIPKHVGWYIAGFTDGEGSFNISFRKKSDYKTNWQPVLSFNVSQKDKTVLSLIKQSLDCGIIKQRKDGLFSYDVTSPTMLQEKVIPFFNEYNFFSRQKQENYKLFSEAVYIMFNKEHLQIDGLKKLIEIRERINIGKGRTRKYTKKNILLESSETIR